MASTSTEPTIAKGSTLLNCHDDLRWRVISYLPSADLLCVEACSHTWRRTVTDDLWRDLLSKYLSSTRISVEENKYVPLANVSSTLSLLDRVKAVPMSRLRELLRNVNTSHCIEKKEFQKLLAIRLFFRHVNIGESVPDESASSSSSTSSSSSSRVRHPIAFPRWTYAMSEHKLSYYFTIRDLRRSKILLSGLCAIEWAFRFKHVPESYGWKAEFFADYTMTSQISAEPMQWQVRIGAV
jgi:hypothetical protein